MQTFIQYTSGRIRVVSAPPVTMRHMKAALRRTAVVLTALVSVVALGAVPAHAVTVALSLPYVGCTNSAGTQFDYVMRVNYTLHRYYPNGSRVVIRYWGDDPSSDDLLMGPVEFRLPYWLDTGYLDVCVNSSTLDEDWGEDEIYAGVRVYDAVTGVQHEVAETNRIHGYF